MTTVFFILWLWFYVSQWAFPPCALRRKAVCSWTNSYSSGARNFLQSSTSGKGAVPNNGQQASLFSFQLWMTALKCGKVEMRPPHVEPLPCPDVAVVQYNTASSSRWTFTISEERASWYANISKKLGHCPLIFMEILENIQVKSSAFFLYFLFVSQKTHLRIWRKCIYVCTLLSLFLSHNTYN